MRITTTHGTYEGRTIESIIRREYGRKAGYLPNSDPSEYQSGTIVQWSPEGDAYRVLGVVKSVEESPAPPESMSVTELEVLMSLLGLTQDGLAECTGIAVRTVRRWKAGQQIISPAMAEKLRALRSEHDKQVEQLLDGDHTGEPVGIPGGDYPRGWYVAVVARAVDRHPNLPLAGGE